MSATLPLHDEIERDGEILGQVIEHLAAGTPLSAWPETVKGSLRVALEPSGLGRIEEGKASDLRDHLFGIFPTPDLGSAPGDVFAADRIRADLRDLVPACAGDHLADYDAMALRWISNAAPERIR